MAKKVQLPVIGGLRKSIIPGGTTAVGTTIAELGSATVTLAQLKELLGITSSGGGSSAGGVSASINVGPGLSGGGPVVGIVSIGINTPIPTMLLEGEPGEDGLPGLPGTPGAPGVAGFPGTIGMPGLDGDQGEDGLPGLPGVSGATGAAGLPGAFGLPGMDGEPGEDGLPGFGMPGPTGGTGAAGAPGSAGVAGLDGDQGEDGLQGQPGFNASALIQQRGANWSAGLLPISVPINDVPLVIAEDCTIQDLTILTEGGTGSCAIDIWRIPFGAFPPTVANTIISGSSYPTISSGVSLRDTTLTGFSATALSEGDTVVFHLRSTSVFTSVTIMLSLKRVGDTTATGYTDARVKSVIEAELTNSATVTWSIVPGVSIKANAGVGANSIGTNGYRTNGDGTIEQWGIVANGGLGPTPVSFPLVFPTACLCVLSQDVNVQGTINQTSVSTTGFTSTNGALGSSTYWRAFGY